jgi:hypothetical protein
MKHSLFHLACGALLFTAPLCAAPQSVSVTFKTADGKPVFAPHIWVFDDQGKATEANAAGGRAELQLEPGIYSVWLRGTPNLSDVKETPLFPPAKLWHGLGVKPEGAQKWELKVPIGAAIEGRILLPDGKPVAGCPMLVQSATNGVMPGFAWPKTIPEWAALARGAKGAFAMTTTNRDGTFRLDNLAPGAYALDVYEPTTKKWFSIPYAPALEADAKKGAPTKIGDWKVPQNGWTWLFDKELRYGGAPSKYDGQGETKISNGVLRLGVGKDITGVNWPDYDKHKLPRLNYELSFDARRVEGSDFFCGLTFPYGEKQVSWIVGGWGGRVVGLSNVNSMSADENETTQARDFEDRQWYRLRLRVSKAKIEAWIDDDKTVDLVTADKEFSIRWSVEPSQPLGIATWRTGGEIRDMRIRALDADEVATIEKNIF